MTEYDIEEKNVNEGDKVEENVTTEESKGEESKDELIEGFGDINTVDELANSIIKLFDRMGHKFSADAKERLMHYDSESETPRDHRKTKNLIESSLQYFVDKGLVKFEVNDRTRKNTYKEVYNLILRRVYIRSKPLQSLQGHIRDNIVDEEEGNVSYEDKERARIFAYLAQVELEQLPEVRFTDLDGLEWAVARINRGLMHQYSILDKMRADKITPKRTTLLNGKPGMGKTYFAAATAYELKLKYGDSIVVMRIEASKLIGKSVGGSDIIHYVFEYIRAKGIPVILVIDEAELLMTERGMKGVMAHERTSALLSEIDGLKDKGGFPLYHVIFTTNNNISIDPAFIDRFDDILDFQDYADEAFVKIWRRIVKINTLKLEYDDIIDYAYGCNPRTISKISRDIYLEESHGEILTRDKLKDIIWRHYQKPEMTSSDLFIQMHVTSGGPFNIVAKVDVLTAYSNYCTSENLIFDGENLFWKKLHRRFKLIDTRPRDKTTGKQYHAFRGISLY